MINKERECMHGIIMGGGTVMNAARCACCKNAYWKSSNPKIYKLIKETYFCKVCQLKLKK